VVANSNITTVLYRRFHNSYCNRCKITEGPITHTVTDWGITSLQVVYVTLAQAVPFKNRPSVTRPLASLDHINKLVMWGELTGVKWPNPQAGTVTSCN
jgi:hypothetical protein